jgi:pimeloyl-ACP methyl ester carboxylesterase
MNRSVLVPLMTTLVTVVAMMSLAMNRARAADAAGAQPPGARNAVAVRSVDGTLASGALWSARIPASWNGTLLLYSHGYAPVVRAPDRAPRGLEPWLLAHGYALAASSYSAGGWALAEAVPDQIATLDAFAAQIGAPKRTIAWGNSMGGLVTVALAEEQPARLSGALPSCGSIAGSLGMMNMALDGAFAFKTLLAPNSAIELVHITDDRANAERVKNVLAQALTTPAGRARLALASALAQMPDWTDPQSTEPAANDLEAQLQQSAKSFAMGVFLPRTDQEQRAGGAFSWNTDVDYRKQLAFSGRSAWVNALYRKAGLSLAKDLAHLNATPRVTADPAAVAYMRKNYAPSGRLAVPMLSYHTIGDGMTMVTLQSAYEAMVHDAGQGQNLRTAWIRGAGHCTFTSAEHVAALQALENRIDSGRWQTSADDLNTLAVASGLGEGRFVAYNPAHFLRPCSGSEKLCRGEPR